MNTLYAIEDVVPHRQDMCLLERITQWDQDCLLYTSDAADDAPRV